MKDTSGQTYKELAIPYFKEVFLILDEVLTQLAIPYYLVGVSAVALELLKKGIKPARGTKDIDFAIMISSVDEFEEVVTRLEQRGFHKVKAPWTLYHSGYKIAIDLLPFGQTEEADTLHFTQRLTDLHLLGFREVLAEAVPVAIEEKIAQVPPLHGMVILKLVAWSDRPEERDNDLLDILLILKKYFELEWDDIVTHHFDTFPDGELDPLLVSARVLGRKAALILKKSERLKDRILHIVTEHSLGAEYSPIAVRWARINDWSLRYATQLLMEFRRGITENS